MSTNTLPILYSFRRCPYAIRARLALRYAGIPLELREVVLRNKPAQMLAISPKGTVPVLQMTDGTVLEESLDIMRWALQQHDPQGWLPDSDPGETDALITLNDGPFKRLLDRYKYADRYPEQSAQAYRERAEQLFIAPLGERLTRHAFLLGDTPRLADMAIFPFIRQFAQTDADWFARSRYAALQRWLQGLSDSALFAAVMQKLPPWQAQDQVIML